MATTNTRFVTKNGLDVNGNSITNLGVSGASLTLSGANAVTITTTGATNITLPTSGTLATTTGSVATVTTAAQPNITSLGTLTSLTISGTSPTALLVQNPSSAMVTAIQANGTSGTASCNVDFRLQNTTTGTSATSGFGMYLYGVGGNIALWHNYSADMIFATGNTERFRITSTGALAVAGSGNYGTSGQVLTSNGNAAPSWSATTAITTVGTLVTGTKVNTAIAANLASLNVGGSIAIDNGTGSIPAGSGNSALQVGYLNAAVTSTTDAYVAYGGPSAAAALSPTQAVGNLILSSRNAGTAGISLATSGISRVFISTAGVVNVNNTAASNPVININKNDSGTANQAGGALYLINTHASNTARTANTLAGQVVWQFSQPTSGSPQNAAAIAVYSDAQAGLKTPSYMSFLTNDSTDGGNTVERLRITSTGVTQFKGAYDEQSTAVTATATTNLDLSTANTFVITMGVSITSLTFTNVPASGRICSITLILKPTGAFTVTWPAAVKWAGGTAPTQTATNSKTDIISLMTPDGGTTWYGFSAGLNF